MTTTHPMKRVLITGAEGFCGRYLCRHLLDEYPAAEIYGVDVCESSSILPSGSYAKVDISAPNAIDKIIAQFQPDTIFHLAGTFDQSDLGLLYRINVLGTEELLKAASKNLKKVRVVLASSAAVYGFVKAENNPMDENEKVSPVTHYGVSKSTMEMVGGMYGRKYEGMDVVTARLFNMIGDGLSLNLLPGRLVREIAAASAQGGSKKITVGNTQGVRDFVDVRDAVAALIHIAMCGKSGSVYNVGSGKGTRIRELIDMFIGNISPDIEVVVDKGLYKESDPEMIVADVSKIQAHTGWKPAIRIENSVVDIVRNKNTPCKV